MPSSDTKSNVPLPRHTECVHVSKQKKIEQRGPKKSSVEDLASQGFCIGRYLGEGSYCKVKAATHDGKDIAVKVIAREHLSLDFRTKFLPREIDILTKIDHKNIIRVHKIFNYPRRVYIFMEYIERGDLLNLIRRRGRLSEHESCIYFQQMVSAIQYLHNLNIAHRDLKCENVMIDADDVIKIIDFGFSRMTVKEDGRRELSRTFCGSTAYAAPEVLQGIPYNPMMYDVWSLGCVLFIMVTGTMPFDDSHVRKMVTCQLKRQIRYPSTFVTKKETKEVISHMLEPDVTRRATMKQIANHKWIKDNKIQEKSKTPSQKRLPETPSECSRCSTTSSSISRATQTQSSENK